MKTILLLGGSAQQIPVIKSAHKMGLRTVICDYLPDNPGQYIADVWYPVSTTDIESVYDVAVKEEVDGILAYASDPAALPAAIVSERLGLPTNPASAVATLGNKHCFRRFLSENNFACPKWVEISVGDNTMEIINKVSTLHYPIVIKPTDSSGSKGVSVIYTTHEIKNAILKASKYSRNGILIAEEYIEHGYPNIIVGDFFVNNGKIVFHGDMESIRDNTTSLITVQTVYPNQLPNSLRTKIHSGLQNIITKTGISRGELNIDVIIDRNEKPYFIEIGVRAGGNMTPLQLSDAFDINLIEANIKSALGEPVELSPKHPQGIFITYVLNSLKTGIFAGVEYSKNIKPYIYRENLYKTIGDKIEPFDNARKAVGIIFLHFPNRQIFNNFSSNIEQHIQILLF